MATWHISRINNLTHEVELKSHLGDKINTVVPEEHRELDKHKAYLQSLIDAHEVKSLDEYKASKIKVRKYYKTTLIVVLILYILKLKFIG